MQPTAANLGTKQTKKFWIDGNYIKQQHSHIPNNIFESQPRKQWYLKWYAVSNIISALDTNTSWIQIQTLVLIILFFYN